MGFRQRLCLPHCGLQILGLLHNAKSITRSNLEVNCNCCLLHQVMWCCLFRDCFLSKISENLGHIAGTATVIIQYRSISFFVLELPLQLKAPMSLHQAPANLRRIFCMVFRTYPYKQEAKAWSFLPTSAICSINVMSETCELNLSPRPKDKYWRPEKL